MLRHKKNNKEHANKDKHQRIMSIYSSQQILPEHMVKAPSLPLKKTAKNSSHHPRQKSKQHVRKDKSKGPSTTLKVKPPQIYERIPITFVNSNSNSEIEFSNYSETLREVGKPPKKHLYINCDEKSFLNDMMKKDRKRIHIEQQSAVKIQKVFRGYRIRKLLQKYIQEYEEKLNIEKNQLKRKATFVTSSQQDSFYSSDLKNSYFLSDKKRRKNKMESQNRQNFEFQSSILPEHDHYISIQEPELSEKHIEEEERKESLNEKSSLLLNQSSIAPQGPQISLSFGQQSQHSPHFPPSAIPSKKSHPYLIESPSDKKKNKIGFSQDNTRDIVSQNITISPNYYRHNRSERSQQSNFNSIQKSEHKQLNSPSESMEKLKSIEKAKWEQVIQFVNQNLKGTFTNEKTKEMMSVILDFSVKNRQELNTIEDQSKVTPTTITNRMESEDKHQNYKYQNFKKKKDEEYDESNLQKIKKNQNLPLIRKSKIERMSILDRTLLMKQYFLKNMHLEDHQIDKMMNLRQAVLRRKQSESLIELNHLLENNMVNQEQFIERLFKLTHTFEKQKKDIEQTKEEIYIGYKAQFQLLKNTALDAKYLGYNIPFCRSMEIFPNQPKWRFDSVMIDQLNHLTQRNKSSTLERPTYKNPKEFGTEEIDQLMRDSHSEKQMEKQVFQKSQSDEDVSFTYEETNIYKQNMPTPFGVNEFINEEMVNSPKMKFSTKCSQFAPVALYEEISDLHEQGEQIQEDDTDHFKKIQCSIESKPRSSIFTFKDESESEQGEEIIRKKSSNQIAEEVSEIFLKQFLWEFLEDILLCPRLKQKFKLQKKLEIPQIISNQEKILFLELCLRDLPKFSQVQGRLNQKMYPNLKQMLFSMRECDSDQQSQEYIQIGQYEYLLNQDICFEKIETYMKIYRQNRVIRNSENRCIEVCQEFKKQFQQFSTQKLKTAAFQHKIIQNKQLKKIEDERQEYLRIELHMLFDVWNEELIKYRQNKNGYSGIGLNELSLSLIDRVCKEMKTEQQYRQMMHKVAHNIEQMILNDDSTRKITEQFEGEICKNDSQWILYTQQALQYGFDVVKLIELELIFDLLNDLRLIEEKQVKYPLKIPSNQEEQEEDEELNSEEEEEISKKVLNRSFSSQQQDDSFYM